MTQRKLVERHIAFTPFDYAKQRKWVLNTLNILISNEFTQNEMAQNIVSLYFKRRWSFNAIKKKNQNSMNTFCISISNKQCGLLDILMTISVLQSAKTMCAWMALDCVLQLHTPKKKIVLQLHTLEKKKKRFRENNYNYILCYIIHYLCSSIVRDSRIS